jgi:hypothetical protein
MNIDVYVAYDLPVPYKGLMIYPALVKDYGLFSGYATCLTLDKNSIHEKEIIKMKYLDYLFYCTEKDPKNTPYLIYLDKVLSICLRNDKSFVDLETSIRRYGRDEQGKTFIRIGESLYSADDFEEIRKIICEQNLLELPDENTQKEVRDSIAAARAYKDKLAGVKHGSFEDHLVSLSIATGWTFEYIYQLTIRKYAKSIQRLDNLIHYKIFLGASMSGMVEFKDKSFIKHWLTSLDSDDKLADATVDMDTMTGKVSMESAKK